MTVIAQGKLRNEIGALLRRAESGERFIVTVAGRPVAELGPLPGSRTLAPPGRLTAILAETPPDPAFAEDLRRMRQEDEQAAGDPWGSLIDTSVLAGARPLDDFDDEWAVSVITVGELEAGVLLAADHATRARRLALLAAVVAEAPALPVDRHVASRYGELRAGSGRKPTNDLWIAATALAHDLTLVTADERQAALPLVRSTLLNP